MAGGSGYASMAYAASLAGVGRPFWVEAWGTPVLLRAIPGAGGRVDAMGPYPVCALAPGADIGAGLAAVRAAGAVSVVLVADPLAGPDAAALRAGFGACRAFKTHHVVDRGGGEWVPSAHHAARIRRGQRRCTARVVPFGEAVWQAHWGRLYAGLAARRGIVGLQRFSAAAFAALGRLDEGSLVAFAAEDAAGAVLAMQLWVVDGDRAYSHLTAADAAGYRAGASYVVYAAAIAHLGGCRLLDLGGGAGLADDPDDALAAFKRGFATGTRTAHLCCAVLDAAAYGALCRDAGGDAAGEAPGDAAGYFPAYRAPA